MEEVRKFNVADAVLLEFAGTEIEHLQTDLVKFTALDPDLNSEKAGLLASTYQSALTFGTDETELGKVKKLTEDLSKEIKNCVSIFKEVRYFALKKFKDSPAVLKQFGLNSYREARKNQPKLVLFMYELVNTVETYKSDLLAAGLKETVIDSIKPAADALAKSNVTQETGKDGRPVQTEGRVKLLNKLYDILAEFSEASKIVFAGDPLKRSIYILPHNRSIDKGGSSDATPK